MTGYYPVTLLLAGRRGVVVGGGLVAERKARDLLAAGARVTVVAPEVTKGLDALARAGEVRLIRRAVEPTDLDGAHLVILATDDGELNARLSAQCEERGLLVNVVDCPELGNFHVPATMTRGPVTVAISTGGASPALARRLRETIEAVVGEEHGALAELMGELRAEVKARWPRQVDRAQVWHQVLESEALDLLRQGRAEEARCLARRLLGLPD